MDEKNYTKKTIQMTCPPDIGTVLMLESKFDLSPF